jgi:type II secretory pathway pseudopilin PulG
MPFRRAGFTILEAVMVLLIVMTIIGVLTPSVIRQITHARVNRAARVVAADFYLAQTTAARSRKPVLVQVDTAERKYTFFDATTSTQLLQRRFAQQTEFKIGGMTANPVSYIVFPSGMLNTAVTIQVGDASFRRTITASRAGQVRVP